MEFLSAHVTDIGIVKSTNQDSLCVKIATVPEGYQIAMAIVCDGMGGLEKGELASAEVINSFSSWFDSSLPNKYKNDLSSIADEWVSLLKRENQRIRNYGSKIGVTLGTTFTGFLAIDDKYMVVHVGDSRVYRINEDIEQLTEDHTFIAREIKRGTMTPEEAKVDKRRNMLLQCIGASPEIAPQVVLGNVSGDTTYMLCSDGFRHVISEEEITQAFNPNIMVNVAAMQSTAEQMVETVKERSERDNITVVLIKTI